VRARMPANREEVARLMRQLAEGIGAAHGVKVSVKFNTEFIETINATDADGAMMAVQTDVIGQLENQFVP
ncbi:MAG: hypothetical protein QNL92_00485, partial [Octadecabacter sp.]